MTMGAPTNYNTIQRSHRTRSPLAMGGHVVQRTGLLILIIFLVAYTVAEYFSTRHVLEQCVQLTAYDVLPQSTPTPTTMADSPMASTSPSVHAEDEAAAANDTISADVEEEKDVPSPLVAKVMMMYGKIAEAEVSKRLIDGHRRHAEQQGHSFHLFDREVLDGMWSKQAWLLSVMLEQLRKPQEMRTQWLHWCDADVVLMNPNVPLHIFLPPKSFDHINLLVSNDHNGLNAGSFFIRVSEWGVRFLVDILALRTYRPEQELKYKEQSAMSLLLLDDGKYKNQTMLVPQRWFNAYRGPREGDQIVRGAVVPPNTIKEGDLQLHFSGGKKNKAHIVEWLDYAANETSGWVVPLKKTKLQTEIALFWKLEEERRSWDTPVISKPKAKSTDTATSATASKTGNVESNASAEVTGVAKSGTSSSGSDKDR